MVLANKKYDVNLLKINALKTQGVFNLIKQLFLNFLQIFLFL
jgi:hypothetical protein